MTNPFADRRYIRKTLDDLMKTLSTREESMFVSTGDLVTVLHIFSDLLDVVDIHDQRLDSVEYDYDG